MASILQSADAKSLVIIDELGRGTSNSDGIGLAWSISEHLQSLLGCLTLMVTHYSMMATELPKLYPNVKVYHMLVTASMVSAAACARRFHGPFQAACRQRPSKKGASTDSRCTKETVHSTTRCMGSASQKQLVLHFTGRGGSFATIQLHTHPHAHTLTHAPWHTPGGQSGIYVYIICPLANPWS